MHQQGNQLDLTIHRIRWEMSIFTLDRYLLWWGCDRVLYWTISLADESISKEKREWSGILKSNLVTQNPDQYFFFTQSMIFNINILIFFLDFYHHQLWENMIFQSCNFLKTQWSRHCTKWIPKPSSLFFSLTGWYWIYIFLIFFLDIYHHELREKMIFQSCKLL